MLEKKEELNITAISKLTNLNHARVNSHLFDLVELGIMREKRFGRIKIYSIDKSESAGSLIADFLGSWRKFSENRQI
ncbi:MAG: helix-turn-helix transcriptional regulator [Chloroflexi bacterium]|nr:helix-turn-helix transcriptional regulator [Chloroflexota bacterium]